MCRCWSRNNESDKKIKIYNKGIEYKKKNINQWLYRTGSIEVPNIMHKESLSVMINDYINFIKNKKKDYSKFMHAERVMKVLKLVKEKL